MKDDNKTKKQFEVELVELRSQNAALKKSTTGSISAELVAGEARRYAESIVGTIREPLLVLDANLKIISANRNFYRAFKVTPDETLGSFIYDLGNKQWDIPKLRELLEEVLPEKEAFDDFEVDHNFESIGHKTMLLNARQIYRKDIGAKMILLAIEDVTSRKEIENGLEKNRIELAATKISEDAALEYAESIIDTVREPLIILDQDLRVVTASRSFYEFFKVKPDETEGQLIYNLGNDQWDIPKLRELLETILPEKTTFDNYEVEHDFATIGKRIMLLNARQIKRALGKERIILLAIEDITERKQLETLLLDSEEQYRRLFETASDGIVLLEKREGRITNANSATEKLLGYNNKESIGNKLQDIGVLLGMDDFQTTMQTLNKNGIINYDDVPVETKSGRHIDTDIYLVDRAKLVQCNIRDVTERKLAEEKLFEKEQLLSESQHLGHIGSWFFDMNGRLSWSEEMYRLYGVSPDTFTPTVASLLSLIHPGDRAPMQTWIEACASGKKPGELEFRIKRQDGTIRFIKGNGDAVLDVENRLMHMAGTVQDITERKHAEEALQKSEEEFRSLAESMPQIVWITRKDGWNIYFNQQWVDYTGLTLEESYGHGWNIPFHPDDRQAAWNAWQNATKNSGIYSVECRLRRADGVYHWWLIRGVPLLDETGEIIKWFGTCTDIDNIKQTEEQLQDTLESLRKSFSAIIQVMVSAVEIRDPYTAGHQLRVADLACSIATEMGLPQDKTEGIRMAGSIHDIGKLSIPAEILSKPTKLTNLEFSLIKEHSQSGYEILKNVESPWPLAQIVYQHHERMDGSGYPRNLKGDEILLEARIMAVADVVEAMASHRPYRPSLGIDVALNEIEKNRGIFYDNTVADVCLRLFREKGYKLE